LISRVNRDREAAGAAAAAAAQPVKPRSSTDYTRTARPAGCCSTGQGLRTVLDVLRHT
jgi:hypothetical protein